MKKIGKISLTTIIFFIVAFLFLAIGLGSLGSVRGTGKAYELRLKGNTDAVEPSVTIKLNNPSYVDKEGKTVTDYYIVRHIYLNVAVLYNDETEYAKINLGRGASESANSWTYEAVLGNYNYVDKQQDVEENKRVTVIENAIGNWFEFDLSATTDDSYFRVASYKYYKLTAASCNVLVNEIVFVGEKLVDADGKSNVNGEPDGKLRVVPAEIFSAPVMNDGDKPETEETAKARAGALLDRQYIPTLSQSSFFRYGREELASLMTVSEMRLGNVLYRSGGNNAAPVYHGDRVYNSLGTSILAFGAVIFGNSPFGLRFFPMLASFGVLVMGYLLVKALSKSERAALVFAVLYALSNFFLGLGHFASPLMIGVFFYVCALYFAYQFYSRGIPKMDTKSVLPLILSGVFCAASVCVNGVYLLAALAVVGLFAAGMVRQNRARRVYLDEAIALAEEEEAHDAPKPVTETVASEEEGEVAPKPLSEAKQRVLDVVTEYRWKNTAAIAAFATALVVGGVLLSLLFLLPVYVAYVKLFDNPVSPKLNIFDLMSRLFAGGFTGSNGGMTAYHPFYTLFTGTGSMYAVTAVVMNTVALLAGLLGVAYAVYKIVLVIMKKIEGREARVALRRAVIGLGLVVTGAILGSFGGGALGFIALVYVGLFVLAAECVKDVCETEWKGQKAAKICVWVGLGLLAFVFLLYAIVTFSIPLPALFMSKLF